MAAGQTVGSDRSIHSLHAYFLRPGNSSAPMTCRVHILRDGRSFSVRRVEARQDDALIFELSASFHTGERGPEHQRAMPSVADPSTLEPFEERFAGRETGDMARWFFRALPFDVRYVDTSPFEGVHDGHAATQQLWFRAKSLPDEPLMHTGALAYATDMTILDPILLHHGMQWTDRAMIGATLDHSLHFHTQVDFSQWLLFDQQSTIAHNGRALATANVWTQHGQLIATVSQEALMRPMAK